MLRHAGWLATPVRVACGRSDPFYAANRALATLSAFMSWLERDRLIERNPCKGIKRRAEDQRHVFLAAGEDCSHPRRARY